ncbi:hypothetical protein T4B_3812 [Trichinella pseudospiralis]|uniref:Uncharacterized protein n=1 Tax=Trichinella pseudospiralis TaxID=6337 RepID=A0A0V0Y5E9_TRIPS|nr:hypothetical protein T4E_5761 [Trichinella pseudospiralis]KRX95386.1 hypothetical protein T4E_10997 [Trichinella pseudospiralis]KRY68099.1 hypothetical protein T4A_11374 [Trichinella pseudospiralis]KRZ25248.1 hypothetical protein T4B_3812 [Trichinella pseudospiralis]KRZ39487.1 hypothetical protein T4C_5435 [Trichinella pseudospiralis]
MENMPLLAPTLDQSANNVCIFGRMRRFATAFLSIRDLAFSLSQKAASANCAPTKLSKSYSPMPSNRPHQFSHFFSYACMPD